MTNSADLVSEAQGTPGDAAAVGEPSSDVSVDLAPAPSTGDPSTTVVGRGIAFPLAIDAGGSLALDTGDDVSAAIRLVVMTAPGERPMRPDFGCAIWEHVFAPINAATLGQMAHAVRRSLSRWEPRIEVDRVVVRPESEPGTDGPDATVSIEVEYRLRSTNDRRNLVFPFYVIPRGGH